MKTIQLSFTEGIIARAELRHQRYVINASRSGRFWIALAVLMLLPAALMSITLFFIALIDKPLETVFHPEQFENLWTQASGVGMAAMLAMNVALYLVVILITLALSANSVSREKLNKTWDVLLLTNVDAKAVVLGKWWASLKALNGDHAMIALLRLGLVGLFVAFKAPQLAETPLGLPTGVTYAIPLALFVAAFTVIDAAFTAALGVAGALSTFPGSVTASLILAVRVFGIGAAIGYFWILGDMLLHHEPYILAGLGGLVVFMLMTWLVLLAAQKIAVWGQVSPPIG
jgi:hypothetical protein